MTTHPSSLSTFAMSAGEEPEPTARTVVGILRTILYGYKGYLMTIGLLRAGFHDRAVEVRRQMLPFRFGVYAAVAPTMSTWRDQAVWPRVSVTRPCTFLTHSMCARPDTRRTRPPYSTCLKSADTSSKDHRLPRITGGQGRMLGRKQVGALLVRTPAL